MSATRLYRLPSSGQRNTAAGIFVGSLVGVLGGLLLVLWLGTQWAAWKLAYQPALGPPLFAPGSTLRAWLLTGGVVAGFGEPEPKAQENFTDPDSRIMKRGGSGFEQCYNAQIAVDETERIIVATGVTQSAADVEQLLPLLDEVEANVGQPAVRCLADAGYRSESNLQALESRQIDGYVAMGREKDGMAKAPSASLAATGRMRRKLATKRGRETYRKRKWIGEPPFAWIKSAMGFDRFHLRGLTKVTSEWDLACLAANLRRMHRKVVFT